MLRKITIFTALVGLAGCQSVGGPGVSSYFDCGDQTMLKVTYGARGAAVQVNKGRTILLRQAQGIGGSVYEGFGYRLSVMGDTATWTGLTKEAPRQCRRVAVPR